MALLSEGRFTLGLGAGERLNEHVVGAGWPSAEVRQEMLREAIQIMRLLWSSNGYVSHRSRHFTVEDARVFDLPEAPIEIFVAASGDESVALAADAGDGVCSTDPESDLVSSYLAAGGRKEATWAQIPISWHADEAKGIEQAHDQFRFGYQGWKVMAELPNPVNFAAATETVTPDLVAEKIPCGPDPERHVAGIREYIEAGFEHIAVVQVGDDQEGFLRFWTGEVVPRLP